MVGLVGFRWLSGQPLSGGGMMWGVLLFIVLPLALLIVGAVVIAMIFGGSHKVDYEDRRNGFGNNFIDWMM